MGNYMSCFTQPRKKTSKRGAMKSKSMRNSAMQDQILYQQATSLLLHSQTMKAYSQRYYRSVSSRAPSSKQDLLRSASVRPLAKGDLVVQPEQLLNKIKENSNLDAKKFVLVHGGGFGAWCWYKLIALLEETGFVTDALDLCGSGIDSTSPNEITSLEQYTKPLFNYLEKLADHEKVYLVGHSFGGACISYAMERYPKKIAKAIFVAGTMVKNGQSALDAFSSEVAGKELLFEYANGSNSQPTSIQIDKSRLKEVYFNRTSSKDIALSSVSIKPVPFAPVVEKLLLTQDNYGSVRRFFIQTTEDQACSSATQERMIDMNPPEQVLKLKGSDHCPFFSKPQSLRALFMEIVHLEPKK
eukprot:c40113_g1_i1 orf=1005-2072(+)